MKPWESIQSANLELRFCKNVELTASELWCLFALTFPHLPEAIAAEDLAPWPGLEGHGCWGATGRANRVEALARGPVGAAVVMPWA